MTWGSIGGTHLELFEIKSGKTFQKEFLKNLHWLNQQQKTSGGGLIYGGDEAFVTENCRIVPWNQDWIKTGKT